MVPFLDCTIKGMESVGGTRYGEHMFDTRSNPSWRTVPEELVATADIERLTGDALREWEEDPTPAEQSIPGGLDHLAPGPYVVAILSAVDPTHLSGHDTVTVLKALSRLISCFQADLYQTMEEVGHRNGPDMDKVSETVDHAQTEVAAALRLTRRAAVIETGLAADLTRRRPEVLESLRNGDIDLRRARVIVSNVSHLEDEAADEVVASILPVAPRLTTGQLAARIQRLAIEIDPESAQKRRREGVMQRRVVTESRPDGIGNIFGLDLPVEGVSAAARHINDLARRLKKSDETRTMDQLRADVFLDLLTGVRHSGSSMGSVNLKIDLTTLAGLDRHTAELAGIGPITAEIAQNIAVEQTNGKWTWTVTHNGRPVATGTTRRRPDTGQETLVRAFHPTCVFPGCRMPAEESDIDHRRRWSDGGKTEIGNLEPLCRFHHIVKENSPWEVEPLPDQDLLWTSPLGHTYTTSGRDP